MSNEIRSGVWRIAGALEDLGHRVSESDPRYGLMGLTLIARGQSGVHAWTRRVPHRALLDGRTRSSGLVGGLLSKTVLNPLVASSRCFSGASAWSSITRM